jgi:hypothetical protein
LTSGGNYDSTIRTVALLLAAFGTGKIDVARSTFAGDTQPKSLTVRIEPHAIVGQDSSCGRFQPAGCC